MVTLKAAEIGQKEFELDHAQRIFDIQRKNPPAMWSLDDENYKIVSGKITPVELDQE